MQIAKLFAGLGFQVDTSGLVIFKKAIADARSELTNITRGGKNATRQFRNLRREVDKLSSSMGKIKNAGGARSVGGSYRNLAADVHRVNNALNSISLNQSKTTKAIGKINASVIAGTPHWNAYRRSIVQTRQTLANLNGDLNRLRANSRIDVRIRNTGGGGGAGGRGGGGGSGGAGNAGIIGLLRGLSLPAMALSGGTVTAGFAGKMAVDASREQTKMENTLLMTSKNAEDFADSLNFVKTEALRLGIASTELGKSFSQMNLSAKGLTKTEKKEMFTGFSEFMVAMGIDKYGQKGVLKAYNQMFALGKISQEEINQLSEHGIPATLVYDSAMKAHNLDSIKAVKALQQKGGLIPELVLKQLSKDMANLAHSSGALAKAQQSSQFKQDQFIERAKQKSKDWMDKGLDRQLGNLFGVLTKLVDKLDDLVVVISEVVTGIKEFKKWTDKVTGGNYLLIAAMFLVASRSKQIGKAITFATRSYARNHNVLRALAYLMRGVFGALLGKMLLRFGLWGIAIYAVSEAFSFLASEMRKSDRGEWTFFDQLFGATEIAGAKLGILREQFRYAVLTMRNMAAHPIDFYNLMPEDFQRYGLPARPQATNPNGNGIPAAAGYNSISEALKKISREASAGDGVLANPTAQWGSRANVGSPTVNAQFVMYVDGDRVYSGSPTLSRLA